MPGHDSPDTSSSPLHLDATLLDEHSSPDFRTVYVQLASEATTLDVALGRIRLSGMDLGAGEIGGLKRIRLLLGEVNALSLASEAQAAQASATARENLQAVLGLIRKKRILIRAAPLRGWTPDFSVFHRAEAVDPQEESPEDASADPAIASVPFRALVGLHWFQRPYPHRGPALASIHGEMGARLAARRFEAVWSEAHDISTPILGIIQRADERAERGNAS